MSHQIASAADREAEQDSKINKLGKSKKWQKDLKINWLNKKNGFKKLNLQ